MPAPVTVIPRAIDSAAIMVGASVPVRISIVVAAAVADSNIGVRLHDPKGLEGAKPDEHEQAQFHCSRTKAKLQEQLLCEPLEAFSIF